MAAEFGGIQVLRVMVVPDTRPGRVGGLAYGVMFLVDGQGPFGFEVTGARLKPAEIIRQLRARAAQVRSSMIL